MLKGGGSDRLRHGYQVRTKNVARTAIFGQHMDKSFQVLPIRA